MPSGRVFSSRLGTTCVAEFRLETWQGFGLVSSGGRPIWTNPNLRSRVSEIYPDMPRVSTRKSRSCFLAWDLSCEGDRTTARVFNAALANDPSSWDGSKAKPRFTSNGWTTQRQRRPKGVLSPWSESELILVAKILVAKISPFIADFSGISLISVIWLVLPNRVLFYGFFCHAHYMHHWWSLFLLCTLPWHHCSGSFSAQFASFPCFSFFAFLNQISFDLVCIQFVFEFPTDLFEALCCLATLCKRDVLLVTLFVLDWSRPLRCRSADFMFVVGRLDFVFFWWKQHLICTDQNVSATSRPCLCECQVPISWSLCCRVLTQDNWTCLLTAAQLRLCWSAGELGPWDRTTILLRLIVILNCSKVF